MGGQHQHVADSQAGHAKPFSLRYLRRYTFSIALLAAVFTLAGFQVARWHGPQGDTDAVQAASLPESGGTASLSADELRRLSPQQQAERLLARAIHGDPGSLDLITQNVNTWRGHLQTTDRLFDLVHTALNSDDLSVRGAAVEIDLAVNNLSKSPDSVARLVRQLHDEPASRPWALWRLGALGNRGVEPKVVLAQLLIYVHDRNEETRYWAVEGLAVLGSDDVIDPLLDRFAHDPAPRVRQRAACNLAQAGMLTKEQRLAIVPQLLNFFDDDALDPTTRGWVYGALRLITGQALGNNADAWRKWWANRETREKQAYHRTGILHA
jgi:HEAT repeats